MRSLSRMIVGRVALVALIGAVSLAISLLHLPALQAALLVFAQAVIGLLMWEVIRSRRQLMQEHAAHVAKSTYLANMSHELRTPLNAIIGFSEIIKEELMGPLGSPKYGEYAGDIHASASHLLDLINDVLELSRIEAGRLELHEAANELPPILVSCDRLLRDRARRAGIDLRVDIPPDLPPIFCDGTKIKQVVLNLLTNAIKFTPRGGSVSVRAYRLDGGIAISVSDTGVGIPAHELGKVLTPFQQAAHSHLMSSEGTGLGLPLAKRLMELHGGRLTLDSAVGKGTRVTAMLPPQRCLSEEGATLPLGKMAFFQIVR